MIVETNEIVFFCSPFFWTSNNQTEYYVDSIKNTEDYSLGN